MDNQERKAHWEKIYHTKALEEVSWFQTVPTTSLSFLDEFNIKKDAKIIDIGGGDSLFVDHLHQRGYTDVSVLDISEASLNRAKVRLGASASKVKWIVSDVTKFTPNEQYDFWHDRAAFHFLTNEDEISTYIDTVQKNIKSDGVLVIGTFSEQGPKKCSGIEIKQYSETSMAERLKKWFDKVRCITMDHQTPFNTIQNFVFCSFRKRE